MRAFFPRMVCLGVSATDAHAASDFFECLQLRICKGDIGLAYKISPMNRESLLVCLDWRARKSGVFRDFDDAGWLSYTYRHEHHTFAS
jgi:hypothetical protein